MALSVTILSQLTTSSVMFFSLLPKKADNERQPLTLIRANYLISLQQTIYCKKTTHKYDGLYLFQPLKNKVSKQIRIKNQMKEYTPLSFKEIENHLITMKLDNSSIN